MNNRDVGTTKALKEIGFKVDSGEQISIIGSKGSGKSTLLAILDGLIYPSSGEFYAFEKKVIEETSIPLWITNSGLI